MTTTFLDEDGRGEDTLRREEREVDTGSDVGGGLGSDSGNTDGSDSSTDDSVSDTETSDTLSKISWEPGERGDGGREGGSTTWGGKSLSKKKAV
jgi:hypothetical protein